MRVFCGARPTPECHESLPPSDDSCAGCEILPLKAETACSPASSCVRTTYARHIDRFFRKNPGLATRFWNDGYFETRAIVTRYLPQELLERMVRDPDETVRMNVALFLSPSRLVRMMNDTDREVRIRVAARIPVALLPMMASDSDYYVRHQVALRIAPSALLFMKSDPDPEVRRVVARRISSPHHLFFKSDPDALVRIEVLARGGPDLWDKALADPDVRVRFWLAEHASGEALRHIAQDSDPFLRQIALRRLGEESGRAVS